MEEEGLEGDGLKGKDEFELDRMLDGLKDRLAKENNRASLVADYIRGLEDEYEWQGRIDEDDEEQEEDNGKDEQVGSSMKPLIVDVDMEPSSDSAEERISKVGWTLDDWVRYRETGKGPTVE